MNRKQLFIAALLVAIGAIGGQVVTRAEDQGDDPAKSADAMMKRMMELATPGKFHKHLEPMIGRWTTQTRTYCSGPEPVVSPGTAEFRWILGGRFVQQDFDGEMMGQRMRGMGLSGYDNFEKQYTSIWADTFGTGIVHLTGTCDESGRTFTQTGTMDDPATGMRDIPMKWVARFISNDRFVQTAYFVGPDGAETKAFELEYTRAK